MRTHLADGLWQVSTKTFTAGFWVEDGRVIECAPILRKRLSYWMTVAKQVGQGS